VYAAPTLCKDGATRARGAPSSGGSGDDAARVVALLELGRVDDAAAAATADVTFENAYALYRSGDLARARQVCDAAIAASPDLQPRLEHLGAQIQYVHVVT